MTIEQFHSVFPDWTDKSQYPDPEQFSLSQWAWEFLRRNPQYQASYAALGLETDQVVRERLSLQTGSGFGLSGSMIDPHTSALQLSGPIFKSGTPMVIHADNRPFQISSFEAAVIIDLRLPLRAQLKLAESPLSEVLFQRIQEGKVCASEQPDNRVRVDKYSAYLRVLDARETKSITFPQVAEKVFPQYNSADGAKVAGNAYMAAVALRDGGYRCIPFLTNPPYLDESENPNKDE